MTSEIHLHHLPLPVYVTRDVTEPTVFNQARYLYGPEADERGASDQFETLRQRTSKTVSIYVCLPLASSLHANRRPENALFKLYEQRGTSEASCHFRDFAVVKVPQGWRPLSTSKDFWGFSGAGGPAQLPMRAANNQPYVYNSLLAAFVYGGGVWLPTADDLRAYNSVFTKSLLPPASAPAVEFIFRQDFLHAWRVADAAESGIGDAWMQPHRFDDNLFYLPRCFDHFIVPQNFRQAPANEQLGTMRSLTPATLSIYAPSPGAGEPSFTKTYERLGAPRGQAFNLAVAQTVRGWLPLSEKGDGWFDRPYTAGRETYSGQGLTGRPVHYYASLLEAYLLGGGYAIGVPEMESSAQRAHIAEEIDIFQRRHVHCLTVQTTAGARAWGDVYAYNGSHAVPHAWMHESWVADSARHMRRLPKASPYADDEWLDCATDEAGAIYRRAPEPSVWPFGDYFEKTGLVEYAFAAPAREPRRRATISGSPIRKEAQLAESSGAALTDRATEQNHMEDDHA